MLGKQTHLRMEKHMSDEGQEKQQITDRLRLYEAIIDKSQNAVLVFNDKFEVIFANIAAGEILTEKTAKLKGRHLSSFIPPNSRLKHEKLVTYFRSSEVNRQELLDWRNIVCCRADGSVFPASITIEKIPIYGSNVFIVFLIDMTDIVEVEKGRFQCELNLFHVRQQKKYALTTMQFHLEKLTSQIAQKANSIKEMYDLKPVTEAMENILNCAFSSMSLNQKVVYIAEDYEKKNDFQLVDRSLDGVIIRVRSLMESLAEAKGVTIHWIFPERAKHIFVRDDHAVEQIIYNILDCAINDKETRTVEVELTKVEKSEDQQISLEFSFRKDECSIPKQLVDLILGDPSNKTLEENITSHQKILCLKLVKSLTDQLNGDMVINSYSESGMEILVSLKIPTRPELGKSKETLSEYDEKADLIYEKEIKSLLVSRN